MPEDTSLQDLILGYCHQVGGLVEPPAYEIHEVLLPDDVAVRWGIESHQKFAFAAEAETGARDGKVTLLHYGHPLVETVVEELRCQSANGLFFVNNVRLEKPGLYAVIEKTLPLPNAKLFPVAMAVERRRLYHYVRFNFKASLIADEKRELILPVWMHLQGGYPLKGSDVERLAALDAENQFRHLEPAEPFWLPKPPAKPLSEEVLRPLLERARQAARHELTSILESLSRRLQRYLELDQARLQQYYDDLKKDAERRLQKVKEDRRPALEAKLTAIESERQAKLADAEQKYRLRVELELVNLAVIAQPKLDLQVEIKKRTAATKRQVAWDPLRHLIEPLTCDVCGQPGEGLYLCEGGHLAHAGCLAPQCVECKRTFCQKCAASVQTCVVCDRPVCVHSLTRCPTCKRATCHEHTGLCHAADGEPQRVLVSKIVAPHEVAAHVKEQQPPTALPQIPAPAPTPRPAKKQETKQRQTPSAKLIPAKKAPAAPTGDYIEVYSEPGRGLVSAYVMVKKRELAARIWELTPEGIKVHCNCEKRWHCPNDGMIYRPDAENQVERQITSYIREFMAEYQVPEKKLHFYRVRMGEAYNERRLMLIGKWKDLAALEEARAGFDQQSTKG